ncbi:MAG: acyl carrier protein [Lactococcus sp.]|jgi:acyl carrier protein|uniref:Acyl carrier protein n=3 Tax=Pseudolactococcus TaxID=3436058 RepID=A0A0D6DU74_9LACT|nr:MULTISPECIES: acyl carrier protein [Lactococcus]MCJ1970079.1 acyl carrier protein [Lactococcus carnosus]MCJ1971378.1 acyl carrier protein [Lactococcus carnosus]MCJ1972633.1 acyl carrier protein [Lactococcus carnosus]MCJ1975065.1 acyl carrier protein [Lactococcus carnosus]MCJ1979743.1 acyl carrier protein [Lactococcus carnosus]
MTISKEALFAKIKESLVKTLDLDAETITLESNVVEDLNADSISLMEFTLALEDEFGIEISDEDAEHILTLGQVVDYISEKIN